MAAGALTALDEIGRAAQQGRVLPGLAYRDAGVYEAEIARIFEPGWISVACGQNVPRPGDLFPVRIAGRSLLVLRDREGGVRVFYNLCRHRGARLVGEPCSAKSGRLVCPYHGWSYSLAGSLETAPYFRRGAEPAAPDTDERAELGLIPLRTAVWRDIVFVNLSGDAQPFERFIAPLAERIAPWTESALRPLAADEYEVAANWKLAAENFLDAYHLPVVHPEIGGGFSGALACEEAEVSDDVLCLVMPDGYGAGESSLPRFPGLGDRDHQRLEVFLIFPNTLLLVEPDNQQVIVLRPQGPGITAETFANYLATDAALAGPLAEARAEIYRQSLLINDQDVALLAGLQEARSMDVGGETRLSDSWDRLQRRFQQLWSRRLLKAG